MESGVHHTKGGNAYLNRVVSKVDLHHYSVEMDHLPRPKRDEESQIREEENTTIFVEWIEDGNRFCFLVVWVDLRG